MAEALAEASKRDESLVWRAGDVNPPTGTAESSQHRHRRRGGRGGRGGPMRDRELTRRAEKLGEAAPARSPDAMGRLARRAPVYTAYTEPKTALRHHKACTRPWRFGKVLSTSWERRPGASRLMYRSTAAPHPRNAP